MLSADGVASSGRAAAPASLLPRADSGGRRAAGRQRRQLAPHRPAQGAGGATARRAGRRARRGRCSTTPRRCTWPWRPPPARRAGLDRRRAPSPGCAPNSTRWRRRCSSTAWCRCRGPTMPPCGHFFDAGRRGEGDAGLLLADADGVASLRLAGGLARALLPPGRRTGGPLDRHARRGRRRRALARRAGARHDRRRTRAAGRARAVEPAPVRPRAAPPRQRALRDAAAALRRPGLAAGALRPGGAGGAATWSASTPGPGSSSSRSTTSAQAAMTRCCSSTSRRCAPCSTRRCRCSARPTLARRRRQAGETDLEPLLGAAAATAWPDGRGGRLIVRPALRARPADPLAAPGWMRASSWRSSANACARRPGRPTARHEGRARATARRPRGARPPTVQPPDDRPTAQREPAARCRRQRPWPLPPAQARRERWLEPWARASASASRPGWPALLWRAPAVVRGAVQPAWRTLRSAGPGRALDGNWQQMQRLAAEARAARKPPPVTPPQAATALKSASDRLGEQGRLNLQGERAVLTLNGASSEAQRTPGWPRCAAARARGRSKPSSRAARRATAATSS